jgi:Flp pilus assembly protein TadG
MKRYQPRGFQRGTSTVEAALVLVLYFSVFFSILCASMLIFAWNNAAFAAAKAGRYAAVHGSSSASPCTAAQIQSLVHAAAGLQNATVTTSWVPDNSAGSKVTVNISLPVSVMVPLVSTKTIAVASYSTMVILQ